MKTRCPAKLPASSAAKPWDAATHPPQPIPHNPSHRVVALAQPNRRVGGGVCWSLPAPTHSWSAQRRAEGRNVRKLKCNGPNSDDRRGAVTETKPVRVSKERHTACVRERRVYRWVYRWACGFKCEQFGDRLCWDCRKWASLLFY